VSRTLQPALEVGAPGPSAPSPARTRQASAPAEAAPQARSPAAGQARQELPAVQRFATQPLPPSAAPLPQSRAASVSFSAETPLVLSRPAAALHAPTLGQPRLPPGAVRLSADCPSPVSGASPSSYDAPVFLPQHAAPLTVQGQSPRWVLLPAAAAAAAAARGGPDTATTGPRAAPSATHGHPVPLVVMPSTAAAAAGAAAATAVAPDAGAAVAAASAVILPLQGLVAGRFVRQDSADGHSPHGRPGTKDLEASEEFKRCVQELREENRALRDGGGGTRAGVPSSVSFPVAAHQPPRKVQVLIPGTTSVTRMPTGHVYATAAPVAAGGASGVAQ